MPSQEKVINEMDEGESSIQMSRADSRARKERHDQHQEKLRQIKAELRGDRLTPIKKSSDLDLSHSPEAEADFALNSQCGQKQPLFFVDINTDKDKPAQRLLLYAEDNIEEVTREFSEKHGLDEDKRDKLQIMLQGMQADYLKK